MHDETHGETVVGWCLLVDRECQMIRVASSYFESFHRQLVRVVLVNTPLLTDGTIMRTLVNELVDLLSPMVGLIVVRDIAENHMTREFCAFTATITTDHVTMLVEEDEVMNRLDSMSDETNDQMESQSNSFDDLRSMVISEMVTELKAEQYERYGLDASPSTLSTYAALSSARRKTVRKRKKPFTSGERNSTITDRSWLKIVPGTVKIVSGLSALASFHEQQQQQQLSINLSIYTERDTLASSIAFKENVLKQFSQDGQEFIKLYTQGCRELELLTLVYKVMAQPDELLMKKLDALEDYEERMRKLGAKLKHSLSPEDLLRTLVTLKPAPEGLLPSSQVNSP